VARPPAKAVPGGLQRLVRKAPGWVGWAGGRAGVDALSGCPGRRDRGGGTVSWGGHSLPILHFLAAFFLLHLMRNNNNDLKSNKRFNNFTNRLT